MKKLTKLLLLIPTLTTPFFCFSCIEKNNEKKQEIDKDLIILNLKYIQIYIRQNRDEQVQFINGILNNYEIIIDENEQKKLPGKNRMEIIENIEQIIKKINQLNEKEIKELNNKIKTIKELIHEKNN